MLSRAVFALLFAACMNALCSRRASWQQPSPTSLGVLFLLPFIHILLRCWLLLLLTPPLPELHITTGFQILLKIDRYRHQLRELRLH